MNFLFKEIVIMDYLMQAGAKTLKAANFDSADAAQKQVAASISKFENEYNTALIAVTAGHVMQIMQELGQQALNKIDQIEELGQQWSQAPGRKSKAAITRKMSGLAREVGNIIGRYTDDPRLSRGWNNADLTPEKRHEYDLNARYYDALREAAGRAITLRYNHRLTDNMFYFSDSIPSTLMTNHGQSKQSLQMVRDLIKLMMSDQMLINWGEVQLINKELKQQIADAYSVEEAMSIERDMIKLPVFEKITLKKIGDNDIIHHAFQSFLKENHISNLQFADDIQIIELTDD